MDGSRLYCPAEDFTLRLRQRLPMKVGFTFTDEQLEALRHAFGERFDGNHAVDMRGRLHLPWSSYYLVFQAGRDRRTDLRRSAGARIARTVLDTLLCAAAVGGLAAGLVWVALALVR